MALNFWPHANGICIVHPMSEEADHRTTRTVRELATDDRAREKLLRHGAEVLSDAELIAIVLGSGMPGENVLDLARRLLDTSLGLAGLVRAEPAGLQRTRGLGAAQVAAAIELGRRVGQLDANALPFMNTPEQVFALLGPRLSGLAQERVYALALDSRGRLLGCSVVIEGTINAVSFRNAEVFREAVVLRATSIILAHNHPSGDPRPSPQDVSSTKSAFAAGTALDIELLDHVIIGQGRFYSLKREGQGFAKEK